MVKDTMPAGRRTKLYLISNWGYLKGGISLIKSAVALTEASQAQQINPQVSADTIILD